MKRSSDSRKLPGKLPIALLLLLAGLLALAPNAAAQQLAPVVGTVTDASRTPVVGFRVVLRGAGSNDIFITQPTDDEGSFRTDIPTGTNCAPIAVIAPSGARLELPEMTYVPVMAGTRFDIELTQKIRVPREDWAFRGADRLFVSFIEDVTFVDELRAQVQIGAADYSASQSYVSEFLVAGNWHAVPTLEVGGRMGYAGTDFDSGGGASGATDLEFWGKFQAGSSAKSGLRWAPGGVLTLPTGNSATGLSGEAARLKLFGALRYEVGAVTLSGNVGLRFNADTTINGVDLQGEFAGSIGLAALMPFGSRVVGVAELYFEGKQFKGSQDQGVFLVGANWKPLNDGFFRLAAGFGLNDGSPDFTFIAGYVFEF